MILSVGSGAVFGVLAATAGGVLFWALGLPAPWLAGAMVATTIAALARFRMRVPAILRSAVFILVGVQVGAAFTPRAVESMSQWPISLAILAASIVAVAWAGTVFYEKVCGWDRASAFFASCPGAFSLMLALAERERANVPQVTVVQCIRLFFLVLVLPPVVTGASADSLASIPLEAAAGWHDIVIMLAAGTFGGLSAERLGLPGGLILGAIPAVAALELSGVVSGELPGWLLVPGYVVLGLLIGSRFAGFTLASLRNLFVLGALGFALALAISAAGALMASWLTGISPFAALIAFAPGGLEVMSIMAFALNLDPAYVGTHQMARYLSLAIALPILALLLRKRSGAPEGLGD